MILVKSIGHIAFMLIHRDDLKGRFNQIGKPHVTPRTHQLAQCDIAHRVQSGIHKKDVVELLG